MLIKRKKLLSAVNCLIQNNLLIMKKQPTVKELMQLAPRAKASGFILPLCDHLAFYASKPFLYLPLSPNQITLLWIFIKLIAALFLTTGKHWIMLAALAVFQLASIIDGVDGTIARYRKQYSLNGIYLDYIGHYLCNSILLITIAIGIFRITGNNWSFVAAAIGVCSMLLSKALTINPRWFTDQTQREKLESLLIGQNLSIIMHQKTNQKLGFKQKMMVVVFDFIRLDNPLNLMFFALLFKQYLLMLWFYALILLVEMMRKVIAQSLMIYKQERTENQLK